MKNLFILFLFLSVILKGQTVIPGTFIDPSGYYSLDTKTKVENGENYGYFGTIKVKLVDSSRIFVDFYVCKGAPNYNSGTFEDTLYYKNGIAARTTTEDASCVITFNFNSADGVTVEEKAKNLRDACGFGNGVIANGFYRKITGLNSKGKSQ